MKTLGILGVLIVIGALALGISIFTGVYVMNTYNAEASLKNTYDAKVVDNSSEFDNTWKKINQVAQVPEAQKDALKDIFTSYADARQGNKDGGQLMQWVKEAVPNVDLSTYKDLMNTIVASRDSWTSRQKELVDLSREYNQNLSVFPSNVVLGLFGFKKIDPKIITSTRTDKAFETGKDDDTELFKK